MEVVMDAFSAYSMTHLWNVTAGKMRGKLTPCTGNKVIIDDLHIVRACVLIFDIPLWRRTGHFAFVLWHCIDFDHCRLWKDDYAAGHHNRRHGNNGQVLTKRPLSLLVLAIFSQNWLQSLEGDKTKRMARLQAQVSLSHTLSRLLIWESLSETTPIDIFYLSFSLDKIVLGLIPETLAHPTCIWMHSTLFLGCISRQ